MQLHCINMNVTKITTLWICFAACWSSDQAGAWVAGSSAGEGWSWRGSSAKFRFYIHSTGSGGLSHLGRPTHLRSASGCRFCIPRSTSGCKFCIWGQPQDATFASEVDLRISWGCWQKVQPTAEINNKSLEVPKTLQKLLSPHPFPLSQGRIILPLDLQTDASVNHVLSAKTVFSHYLSQFTGSNSVMPRGLHNTFFFHDKTLLSISGI